MVNQSLCTIHAHGAPRATSNSPRRSSIMSSAIDRQRRALGKGLSALLPGRTEQVASGAATAIAAAPVNAREAPSRLPIDSVYPNPVQPRVVFQIDRLEELAASIRAN